ncbi:MAG: hypothetical protein AAGC68_13200 [Verrucomicrobiota bacterium]
MSSNEYSGAENPDVTPAVPLEISADLAGRVDEQLRRFAEDADLETVLVVDQSGALVSGISSEEEVSIEVISALAAGASSAIQALLKEVGDEAPIESFQQGSERVVYLRGVVARFILVGVCRFPTPVGLVREKARQIRDDLSRLLGEIEAPAPVVEAPSARRSLRELAMERAAERAARQAAEDEAGEEPDEESEANTPPALDTEEAPIEESAKTEQAPPASAESEGVEEEPTAGDPEPEPTEVLEYLDDGEPEILIEGEGGPVIDSPFETDDDESEEEEESAPEIPSGESIFEVEDDEEDEEFVGDASEEENESVVFEAEEVEEVVFELDEEEEGMDDSGSASTAFGEDDEADDEEVPTFELDFDDEEEDVEEEQVFEVVDGFSLKFCQELFFILQIELKHNVRRATFFRSLLFFC